LIYKFILNTSKQCLVFSTSVIYIWIVFI
jgi:hypothetical protein